MKTKAILAAAVGALALGSASGYDNLPRESGPHLVKRFHAPHNSIVYAPQDLDEGRKVPGVVFDHGLCGAVTVYEPLLETLASYGMVVVANQDQESCSSINLEKATHHPIETGVEEVLHGFKDVGETEAKVRNAVDTRQQARHTEQNFKWLQEQPYVDAANIAFVGHSQGGGAVITAAGEMAEAGEAGPKAIVAIAPWNGTPLRDGTRPAEVVGKIEAPILMFCSPTDLVVPCEGPAFSVAVSPAVTAAARAGMPLVLGAGASIFDQQMMPIFDAADNAVLLEAKDLTHFGLAHVENMGSLHDGLNAALPFAEGAFKRDFIHGNRSYPDVPTAEYAVKFLLDAFEGSSASATEKAIVEKAEGDKRFVAVKEKLGGSAVAGSGSTGRKLLEQRKLLAAHL